MLSTDYGYGHTKEASQLVRNTLKDKLTKEIKEYHLSISVRKADSGYGGPRVEITTPLIELDKRYEYIIDETGQPADSGTLVSRPTSEFKHTGRPSMSARLVTPEALEALNARIWIVLSPFGKDNDDAMTDYFDNTKPLFYGVSYEEAK